MMKKSKFALAVLACAALMGAAATHAAEEVSRALAKPLKAAQDALNAKNYDEALAKLREAQGTAGKTAYDQYVINEFLGPVYARQSKFAEAFDAFSANADSPHLPASGRTTRYKLLAQLAYQLKNYPASIDYGSRAINAGDGSNDLQLIVSQAYYLTGKYKDAAGGMQGLVTEAERAGQRPTETSLKFLWDCYRKLNDDPAQGRIVEKLLNYYPKPDYWANAMATLAQGTKDERLQMQVYRLMEDVGTLKRADQYSEMAQLAFEQGFPGEAQRILEQGFAKSVYTEEREKARNTRLLETVKKQAASEKAGLAKVEKEAMAAKTGDLLVAVGSSYLLNVGDAAKAASLISQGIAKGSLKSPNDAYVMLGLAQTRAKNSADAVKAFGKVDGDGGYERLAKLWSLRAR
jgi:tetratricopeptide (TPR) repeat protein